VSPLSPPRATAAPREASNGGQFAHVLSVGGTSLYVKDSAGTYNGENVLERNERRFSQVESEPAYQQGWQTTGVRTTPDVSYDGDPNTGLCGVRLGAVPGFERLASGRGTSARRRPQWAALIAIANQGRALSGLGSLNGTTQTLPALYNLYASPSSASYSTYTFTSMT